MDSSEAEGTESVGARVAETPEKDNEPIPRRILEAKSTAITFLRRKSANTLSVIQIVGKF
jgi:hypothetical protein